MDIPHRGRILAGFAVVGVAGLVVALLPGPTGQSTVQGGAGNTAVHLAPVAAAGPTFTVQPAPATAPTSASAGSTGKAKAGTPKAGGAETIDYLGHKFTVPASWQIVDLAKNPSTCVRFDSNTVYLGTPGTQETCPASGVGQTTESMLIQPAQSAAAASSVDDTTSKQISTTGQGVTITASYGTDEAQVSSVINSAGLPAPVAETPAPAPAATSAVTGTGPVNESGVAQMTQSYSGLGFDACATPSTATMSAWGASPFSAVGIYIGGQDRYCAQPNLTSAWISAEAQAGWHFLPIYVGPQVVVSGEITSPAAQGVAAANDAVAQAQAIGIGYGSLIYYDMEDANYTAAETATDTAFLSAWTSQLHALDYLSGIYGSENGTEGALAAAHGSIVEPDVIDVANWNGQADDDPGSDPSGYWTGRRVHQFLGGSNDSPSYGGVTINIDQDYFGLTAVVPICTFTPSATTAPNPSASQPVRATPIICHGGPGAP